MHYIKLGLVLNTFSLSTWGTSGICGFKASLVYLASSRIAKKKEGVGGRCTTGLPTDQSGEGIFSIEVISSKVTLSLCQFDTEVDNTHVDQPFQKN